MHKKKIFDYQRRIYPYYSDTSKKNSPYTYLYHLALSKLLDNEEIEKNSLEYLNAKINSNGLLEINHDEINGNHSKDYIDLHMSSIFYQSQNLDSRAIDYLDGQKNKILSSFKNLNFDNAWSISNEIMAWSTLFSRYESFDNGKSINYLADFLLSHDTFQNGLWTSQSLRHKGTINSIAATFHYLPLFMYLKIKIPGSRNYLEIVNSIKLNNGFFSAPSGYACIDYDSIFLIFYFLFFYADELDINERTKAKSIIDDLRNSLLKIQQQDGGFPEYGEPKQALSVSLSSLNNFLKSCDLHSFLWNAKKIYENKYQKEKIIYANSALTCGSKIHESNIFSTWFRFLTFELLDACDFILEYGLDSKTDTKKDIPGLGYNPIRSLVKKTLK